MKEAEYEYRTERNWEERPVSLDLSIIKKKNSEIVWWKNMTHNLHRMADKVKCRDRTLGDLLWYPEKEITEEYIEDLGECLDVLVMNREELEKFNPPNGWGNYTGLVEFVTELHDTLNTMKKERGLDLGEYEFYASI